MEMSKKKAKTISFKMLGFISPLKLLKSINRVEKIQITKEKKHNNKAWELLEKKLLDLGGPAVYPSQPFKHGYRKIYPNKEDLIRNPIGIRSPLTDEQLKMLSKFVGLAETPITATLQG